MQEIAAQYSLVTFSSPSGNSSINVLHNYLKAVPECKIYFARLWLQGFPLSTIPVYEDLPLTHYASKHLTRENYQKIRTLWLKPYLEPLNSIIYQPDPYFISIALLGALFCESEEYDVIDENVIIKNNEFIEKFKELVPERVYLLGLSESDDFDNKKNSRKS